MATLYDSTSKQGFPESSNTDLSDVSLPRNLRETGGRKVSPATPANEGTTLSSKGNGDHVIELASTLSAYSSIVTQAAELARTQLDTVRRLENSKSPTKAQILNYRSSFSSQIATKIRATSPKAVESRVAAAADVAAVAVQNSFPQKNDSGTPNFNPARPDMESVAIQFEKGMGSVDSFFATVSFQLPNSYIDAGKVKLIRVFRNTLPLSSPRPPANISLYGVDKIIAANARSRSKNLDNRSQFEKRLTENGVRNSISPINPFLNQRVGTNADSQGLSNPAMVERPQADGKTDAALRPYVLPESLMHLDLSVVKDLKTLANIRMQNPSLAAVRTDPASYKLGADTKTNLQALGISHFADSMIESSGFQGQKSTPDSFREVMHFSPDTSSPQAIGQYYRFTFDDPTIRFGSSYQYFITTVDDNMLESTRSDIVQIDVDGSRIPDPPTSIAVQAFFNYVTMNIKTDDFFIEKYEIYRKEVNAQSNVLSNVPKPVEVVSTIDGFVKKVVYRSPLSNGYTQMNDCLNSDSGGSTFIDRSVIAGRKYVYRVYSVDIFGNKSESPKEFEAYVPEKQRRPVELVKPDMHVEVDAATGKMRITLKNNDFYVRSLQLGRRDLTIGERNFGTPFDVRRLSFGTADHAQGGRHFEGELLNNKSLSDGWLGRFDLVAEGETEPSREEIVFIDKTVSQDHTYQYRLYGTDKFGNKTQFTISPPTFVTTRAIIDRPTNLQVRTIVDQENGVKGVYLSWQDGNVDATSEEMVGDQSERADKYLKTLFQIQRKRVGDEEWKNFPLVDSRDFFDPLNTPGLPTSQYRPPYVELNESYYYRVQAYQSGNFISNVTLPTGVRVFVPPLPVVDTRITSSPDYVRPCSITLSWNDDGNTGPIDRWEIQRVGINRFAADKVDISNQLVIASLPYRNFKNVHLESSRYRERGADEAESKGTNVSQPSSHFFTDYDVGNGNVYFYRIRSISPWEDQSDWRYMTMRMDDEITSRIVDILLSQSKKNYLAGQMIPLSVDFGELDRVLTFRGVNASLAANAVAAYARGAADVKIENGAAKLNLSGLINSTPLSYMLGLTDRANPSGVPSYFRLIR